MRRIVTSALGGLLALSSASCSKDATRLVADVAWSLTCSGVVVDLNTTCSPSMFSGGVNPSFDYRAYQGEAAVDRNSSTNFGLLDAECRAVPIGGGYLELTLRATTASGSIQIHGLNVRQSTGAYVAGTCRTTVVDGPSTYGGSTQGVCTDQAPTAGAPCQISNLVLDPNHADGPSVDLDLFCTALPMESLPGVKASVRDALVPSSPAFLHFGGCTGL